MSVALGIVITTSAAACDRSEAPSQAGKPAYRDVLFEDLVGTRWRYHHQRVRVAGICQIEFEGTVLWFDEGARREGRLDKAIWLRVGWPPPTELKVRTGQEVVVEALFDATVSGHMGCCQGMLDDIRRIDLLTADEANNQRRRAMERR